MSDLSQRAQQLLRAGRSGLEPGPGAADRVRDKLAEAVAASPGAEAGAGSAAGTSAGVKAALAVVGLSAAIAIAYVVLKPGPGEAPPPPEAEPTLAAPATAQHDAGFEARGAAAGDAAHESFFEPNDIDAGARAETAPDRAGRPPARRASRDAAPPDVAPEVAVDDAQPERSLIDELRFIEGARSLLSTGSPERALEVIERHADEFPAGQLGQEAAELRVRALCAAERRDEAEAAASRLGKRWPESPFAARSGPVCGS